MRYCDIVRKIEGKVVEPQSPQRAKGQKHWEALRLWLKGHTYRAIGEALSVSPQRAQQMIAPRKSVREAVKARAKNHCEICKIPIAHGHIHHKEAVGKTPENFNALDNLQYLCMGCHRMRHIKYP